MHNNLKLFIVGLLKFGIQCLGNDITLGVLFDVDGVVLREDLIVSCLTSDVHKYLVVSDSPTLVPIHKVPNQYIVYQDGKSYSEAAEGS